jgi:DNA polymerase I
MTNTKIGGGLRAIPFKYIACVDFEYQVVGGNKPKPVCMVVREARSGQTRRYGQNELERLRRAPFETGSDSVMVAYAAAAELGCFRVLGWKFPDNVIDLYAEFRNTINGSDLNASLLDALAFYNLPHMDACLKDSMRDLVMRGARTREEFDQMLNYCESDVLAVEALISAMGEHIHIRQALLRGRYAAAVARIEDNGIPIDERLLRKIRREWRFVRKDLVAEVDRQYGFYQGLVFKLDRFSRWLNRAGIPWPRLPSGLLDLSDDAFKLQEATWPIISPLRELRHTIRQVNLDGLRVGSDGRSRTSLRPFSSVTGRNQPSTTSFAFGPAKWMRAFMQPDRDQGLAYIDFSSQEIGVAGGLAQDERLIAAYTGEDSYMAFAVQAGLVGTDATKHTHPDVRNACKAVVLGLNYGMRAPSIALQAGITVARARELIQLHKRTYLEFWRWSDDMVSSALLSRKMTTVFGWHRLLTPRDRITSIMNWPMQANGAEMMRLAAIAATEAGIGVCAPVHDAFLIAAPLDRLEHDMETMRAIMTRAGAAVCGVPIRTEAKLIRYPDRYMEGRGVEMWNRVVRLANVPQASFEPNEPSGQ